MSNINDVKKAVPSRPRSSVLAKESLPQQWQWRSHETRASAAAAGTALRTVSTLMRMRTTRPKSAQIYTSSRLPALHIIVTDFEVL